MTRYSTRYKNPKASLHTRCKWSEDKIDATYVPLRCHLQFSLARENPCPAHREWPPHGHSRRRTLHGPGRCKGCARGALVLHVEVYNISAVPLPLGKHDACGAARRSLPRCTFTEATNNAFSSSCQRHIKPLRPADRRVHLALFLSGVRNARHARSPPQPRQPPPSRGRAASTPHSAQTSAPSCPRRRCATRGPRCGSLWPTQLAAAAFHKAGFWSLSDGIADRYTDSGHPTRWRDKPRMGAMLCQGHRKISLRL